jgi:hypothetical protein
MELSCSNAISVFVSDRDVYATGNLFLYPPEGGQVTSEAVMWKNGSICWRSGMNEEALGNSVFVSGNDVYIAGYGRGEGPYGGTNDPRAILWKNGKAQYLPFLGARQTGFANSVFVSGKDVYVAGTYRPANYPYDFRAGAVLWKNGAAQYLSPSDATPDTEANSVYVSGGDVYVAGQVSGKAALWKNGAMLPLSLDSGSTSWASSVFVSGGDVYVAGGGEYSAESSGYAAILWKNGEKQNLSDGSIFGVAHSIFVIDADVYVAGETLDAQGLIAATLWKNGAKQNIDSPTSICEAQSVFAIGGDVYVGGAVFGYAAIWKNGAYSFPQFK